MHSTVAGLATKRTIRRSSLSTTDHFASARRAGRTRATPAVAPPSAPRPKPATTPKLAASRASPLSHTRDSSASRSGCSNCDGSSDGWCPITTSTSSCYNYGWGCYTETFGSHTIPYCCELPHCRAPHSATRVRAVRRTCIAVDVSWTCHGRVLARERVPTRQSLSDCETEK